MRNPVKNRNAATGWLAAFAGLASVMSLLRAPGPAHGWPDVVMVFAVSFAGFALFAIPFYQLEASRYHRLMRGEDVIARWTVSERDWKHFVMDEPARNSAKGADANIIELNPKMTAQGVDVVIGKNAIIVGGDFHSLPRAGLSRIYGPSWLNGSPPCLEFIVSSPNTREITSAWTLRFPVAQGAQSQAAAVQHHYQTRAPELTAQRDPKRMRGIGMVIAVLGAIALLWGLILFRTNLNPTLLITLLISGIMLTPGGLLIAIVWHRRMPRAYKKYPY